MVHNALTIDVEEYFHAENLRPAYPRERWDDLESRVDEPMDRLRRLLRKRKIKATFFVLGWLAERKPWLVRALVEDGHEVASHGHGHELLTRLDPETFRQDLRSSTAVLEKIIGKRPRGYRAPCFTITPATRWALRILCEEGYEYDSSVFPIRHDRYGDPDAPPGLHEIRPEPGRRIAEAPPATVRALGRNWPVAGGGYLRLFPWQLCAAAIQTLNAAGQPAIVYLHPWELDPGQPAHPGVPLLKRVRHSIGTGRVLDKLERLLDRFPFGTLEGVLERAGLIAATATARAAARRTERRAA